MNFAFLGLFLAMFVACNNVNEAQTTPASSKKLVIKSYANANVPNALKLSGVRDFRLNKEGKTWQDVDKFYQTLSSKLTNPVQLEAAQGMTACLILDDYGLLHNKSMSLQPTIEKYIEIVRNTQYATPQVYIKIYKYAKDNWASKDVSELKNEILAILDHKGKEMREELKSYEKIVNNSQTSKTEKEVSANTMNIVRKYLASIEDFRNL